MKTKTFNLSRLETSLILIHAPRFSVEIVNLKMHSERTVAVKLKGTEKDINELINFIDECNSE
jgi:hypothetical protein